MTFKWKTIVGVACIQALTLILIVWTSLHVITVSNEKELIKRTKTTTELFASFNKDAVISHDLATLQSFVNDVLKHPGVIYARVARYDGIVLAQSGDENILARPFAADELYRDIYDGIFDAFVEISEGGKLFGRVEVGFSVEEIKSTIASARNKMLTFACFGMILTTLFSYMLGDVLTRRLEQLKSGLFEISNGKLGFQVNVSGSDDLAKTALAFNKMSSQLETEVLEHKKADKEKQELEEQLRQAHKMEAIGTMAGGIAHDFNNILSVILGYSEMVRDEVEESSSAKKDIGKVLKAGNRAKELVQHILSFSRKSQEERVPSAIHLVVEETIKLLRASIPTTIEIQQDIDPECGTILANPTQLHQVIMNLCTNASQAMDEDGGILIVSLGRTELSASDLSNEPSMEPGQYVKLTVSDNGTGIEEDYINRVFDPYFTTKGVGKGSGMGLAVVHGIAKSHGGMITVDSTPGKGTTFDIFFPIIKGEVESESTNNGPLPTGKERILVVDDEEAVLDVTKRRLENLGYQVTTEIDAAVALDLFSSDPDSFDLIISDQTMPKLTGEKLAKKILEIRPDMPIIICTGYSSKLDPEKAASSGISAFIMKPVGKENLAHTIREVLDE